MFAYYILFFALDSAKISLLSDINKIYFQLVYIMVFLWLQIKNIFLFYMFYFSLALAFYIM